MYHYLFTNDLRISHLEDSLVEAGECFKNDCVPSNNEDKNANNNMNTLGFYFNLTQTSKCAVECANKNVRTVVLNFIKKFQFPNPRTKDSFKSAVADGIQIAPMRIILRLLYMMNMQGVSDAYLTKSEIADFIFFNAAVAKTKKIDYLAIIKQIEEYRLTGSFPTNIEKDESKRQWKQETRQVREMVKVLTWSGCIVEGDDGHIRLESGSLTKSNKADLFDILTYEDFWSPVGENFNDIKKSYQEYMDLQEGDVLDANNDEEVDENQKSIKYETKYKSSFSRNRILFGAPGTGKSFTINRDRIELLGKDNEDDYERVTFHPDYSYANFVGTFKPVMVDDSAENISLATEKEVLSILTDETKTAQEKYDQLYERFKGDGLTRLPLLLGLYTDESFKTRKADGSDAAGDNSVERNHGRALRPYVNLSKPSKGKKDISYEYVPGPFMRMYVKALKNSRTDNITPFLLIIEEINRANVAAVFGDVFQLLDRGDDFVSEYPIQATEDIKKYLVKELGGNPDDYDKIKIPDNMFIWATMNSADQGVFPMDTAFKRRWDFTYLGIDDNDEQLRGKYVTIGSKQQQCIEWNELRKAINDFLAESKINEDKQLGPYFISKSIVVPKDGDTEIDSKKFCDAFKNKVLMYLFDDAAKQKRPSLFEGSAKGQTRYSKICEAFDEQGIGIFNSKIQNAVKVKDLAINGHQMDENGNPFTDSEE